MGDKGGLTGSGIGFGAAIGPISFAFSTDPRQLLRPHQKTTEEYKKPSEIRYDKLRTPPVPPTLDSHLTPAGAWEPARSLVVWFREELRQTPVAGNSPKLFPSLTPPLSPLHC